MTERPEPGPAQPAARGGAVPSGALEDLVVVSIAQNLPGPVAAARLQGLGARVVTIQPPSGDPLRHQLPELFEHLHRGQAVLSLDLKSDEGRERLEGLLEGADLLLSSSRAGALRRLGLDFASVHPRHPGLCQVDLVGFPGDHADRPRARSELPGRGGAARPGPSAPHAERGHARRRAGRERSPDPAAVPRAPRNPRARRPLGQRWRP